MNADTRDDDSNQLRHELAQFTGREQQFHRFPIDNGYVFTEGVRHLAWRARARWLIADIALAQSQSARVRKTPFQVWKLIVNCAGGATLECEDGNGRQVFTRRYDNTDFPLPEIILLLVGKVIYLPSEH